MNRLIDQEQNVILIHRGIFESAINTEIRFYNRCRYAYLSSIFIYVYFNDTRINYRQITIAFVSHCENIAVQASLEAKP